MDFSATPPPPSSSSSLRTEGTAKKSSRNCEHNKYKIHCRLCSPHNFCEHGPRKTECTICYQSNNCPHGKKKHNCRYCNPEKIKKCQLHNKLICLKCFPWLACKDHPNYRKSRCAICGGRELCVHRQQKHSCAKCRDEFGILGKGFCPGCKKLIADCICSKSGFASGALAGSSAVQLQRPAAPPSSAYAAAVEAALQEHMMPNPFRFDDHQFRFDHDQFDDHQFRFDDDQFDDPFRANGANPFYDDPPFNMFNMEGGKCKRKQRSTRRLRRRTHNTKKKNKMVKRKITKYSRKNKYKLK